jgi:hypothetical protein
MDDVCVYLWNQSFMLLMHDLVTNLYVHFGSGGGKLCRLSSMRLAFSLCCIPPPWTGICLSCPFLASPRVLRAGPDGSWGLVVASYLRRYGPHPRGRAEACPCRFVLLKLPEGLAGSHAGVSPCRDVHTMWPAMDETAHGSPVPRSSARASHSTGEQAKQMAVADSHKGRSGPNFPQARSFAAPPPKFDRCPRPAPRSARASKSSRWQDLHATIRLARTEA